MLARRKIPRPSRLNGTETLCYYIIYALSKVLPDRASERLARLHCATIVLGFISVLFFLIVAVAHYTTKGKSRQELDCRTDIQCEYIREELKRTERAKALNKKYKEGK